MTVEGFVVDLSSHGFVLVGARGCKGLDQLGLFVDKVSRSAIWQKAFSRSMGPKRAVLMGVVRWEKARMGIHSPALEVERVVSIADREADWNKLNSE